MDSYLEISEKVLRAAKCPMTPKSILDAAYRAGIIPDHLYGKTQHKTLQARLSEDILHLKNDGRFFRTKPGLFFLAEFDSDPSIPEKFKQRFSARRRTRDLYRDFALAFDSDFVESKRKSVFKDWRGLIEEASSHDAIRYIDLEHESDGNLPVWSFSIVRRHDQILTYRIGRYRDDDDNFANRRTIGFPGLVSYHDRTLFSGDDLGAKECGLRALLSDLDISRKAFKNPTDILYPSILFAVFVSGRDERPAILLIMEWPCPDWFEPINRRLSLNNLSWMDSLIKPNDIHDFEPWSIAALEVLQER